MAVLGQAVVAAMYGILLISAAQADMHSTVAITAAPAPGPTVVAVPAPAPAPTKPLTLHGKVVAALRAVGKYGAIAGLLDSLGQNAVIKEGITFFAPDDSAFDGLNMNSTQLLATTLDYHVSTTVYSFQQLANLPLNSTLQTAAPDVKILITSAGANALRLDDVAISDPDIYNDGQVSVQGISAVLNTAKYNKGVVPPEASPVAGTPALAPGLITTPTTPKSSSPNTDSNDAAPVVASVARTVLLISSSVSLVLSLL